MVANNGLPGALIAPKAALNDGIVYHCCHEGGIHGAAGLRGRWREPRA